MFTKTMLISLSLLSFQSYAALVSDQDSGVYHCGKYTEVNLNEAGLLVTKTYQVRENFSSKTLIRESREPVGYFYDHSTGSKRYMGPRNSLIFANNDVVLRTQTSFSSSSTQQCELVR